MNKISGKLQPDEPKVVPGTPLADLKKRLNLIKP